MMAGARISFLQLCVAAGVVASCVGCGSGGRPIVALPALSPAPGTYTAAITVRLSDTTRGARIYYTTDGTMPTAASSRYTGPMLIASTVALNAVGIANGYADSALVSATYTIPAVTSLPLAATPVFNPLAGTYPSAQSVTITDGTPGAAIYYTTDGTTPTTGSTLYTGAINVASTQTIEAVAAAIGYSQSAVGSATYTIVPVAVTTSGQWTWMSGSNTDLARGVYGTRGVAAPGNVPGARDSNGTWVDNAGNLWLFGGDAYGSTGQPNESNDLWSYNIATNQWTWVSGSNTVGALGVYGTLGVASPSNVPGSRITGATWVDADGKFWLFGGVGADAVQGSGPLNDIWMFDAVTSMWTWEGGGHALGGNGKYGTLGVPSVNNLPGARDGEATWTDSDGNFWLFGGNGLDSQGAYSYLNDLWKFNPKTKEWTWVSGSSTVNAAGVYGTQGTPSSANVPRACASSTGWADSDGNFWIFGGTTSNTAFNLLNDLWMFNPTTGLWTWVTGSGTINVSGTYGTKGQAAVGNTPGSRDSGIGWVGSNNNLYFFGGTGYSSSGRFDLGDFNDLWTFNTVTRLWTWVGGSNLPVVPGVYGTQGVSAPSNMPGSRVYFSGWKDTSGNFWLFGGNAEVPYGQGDTNDLWRYVP